MVFFLLSNPRLKELRHQLRRHQGKHLQHANSITTAIKYILSPNDEGDVQALCQKDFRYLEYQIRRSQKFINQLIGEFKTKKNMYHMLLVLLLDLRSTYYNTVHIIEMCSNFNIRFLLITENVHGQKIYITLKNIFHNR